MMCFFFLSSCTLGFGQTSTYVDAHERYLNARTQATGTKFACPESLLSLADDELGGQTYNSGEPGLDPLIARICNHYGVVPQSAPDWVCFSRPNPENEKFLPSEKKTWKNMVNLLLFQQSFSRDELKEMISDGGYIPLTSLSQAQQDVFWGLHKAIGLAGPINSIKGFDPSKLMINVDCSADVALLRANGTQLTPLTIFDYTVGGQFVFPKTKAQMVPADIATSLSNAGSNQNSSDVKGDGWVGLDPRLNKVVTFRQGYSQNAQDWADQIKAVTGCIVTLHPDLKSTRIFISGSSATAAQIVHALGIVLNTVPRKIGTEIYLSNIPRPLSSYSSSERLSEALSEEPEVDKQFLDLRRKVRTQLMLMTYGTGVPFPEEWFPKGARFPFKDLPADAQAWLEEIFKIHPQSYDEYRSADPSKLNVYFSNNLWITGYYKGGYSFSTEVDGCSHYLPNPLKD